MLQYRAKKEATPRHNDKEEAMPQHNDEEEAMPWYAGEEEAMPRHTAEEVILRCIAKEARPLLRRSARETICVRSNQLN